MNTFTNSYVDCVNVEFAKYMAEEAKKKGFVLSNEPSTKDCVLHIYQNMTANFYSSVPSDRPKMTIEAFIELEPKPKELVLNVTDDEWKVDLEQRTFSCQGYVLTFDQVEAILAIYDADPELFNKIGSLVREGEKIPSFDYCEDEDEEDGDKYLFIGCQMLDSDAVEKFRKEFVKLKG